ncbi:hypothetical protein [Halorussus pelagicus]|uniref:hypothetical protein n=1 Tax=Halorussus pelagicus TaxID=2505977 RepID=UPI000FFBC946|nr:hypothetical protein [Halorussus pelagicus]
MNANALRADGWQDALASLLMTILAVFFWYTHGLYVNWLVFVAGSCAGVLVSRIYDFAETRPVAGFPVTIAFALVMTAAIRMQSLVAGVVAALTVGTALELRKVYL